MRTKRPGDKGFTLIELIFATTFFSILLMFVVSAFLQINGAYTKGANEKLVSDAARVLLNDITKMIRTSNGPLVIYDEHGESPVVDVAAKQTGFAQHRVINNSSVLRMCSENVRFGWNEYNTVDGPTSPTSDGMGVWTNEWTDRYSDETLRYISGGGGSVDINTNSHHDTETITALKTDIPAGSVENGYATCDDPFVFFKIDGSTSLILSERLRIHDLDINPLSIGGPDGLDTYEVILIVASADLPDIGGAFGVYNIDYREDFDDYRDESFFETKGFNEVTGAEDTVGGVKTTACKIVDRSDFCNVVRLQTVVSTRR